MANSLSNTVLAFKKPLFQPLKQSCSFPFLTLKSQPINPKKLHQLTTKFSISLAGAVSDNSHEPENNESTAKIKPQLDERRLADCWHEMLGENDWTGLLAPINPLLRRELIRYGEMAQACYDAFDYDPYSKYCGSCRYAPREFFERLGLAAEAGYDITRFIYATSNINLPDFFKKPRWPRVWSKNANWIGFIAVSNDETSRKLGRCDVCIAWRGTVTRLEWVADLMNFLTPISSDKIPCPDPTVKVESGFLELYTDRDESCTYCKFSAREQVLTEVNRLVNEVSPNQEMSITITGHSLGGALAVLSGYDISETGVNIRVDGRAVPVCVFTYAGPRVGNGRFKTMLDLLGVKVLRVVNVHDIVPKSPGLVFNERMHPSLMKLAENLPWCHAYSHVGVELALDHKMSPFLRDDGDLVCAHNLEAYLHLLDGHHGKGEDFVLANGRDYALVNKDCDFLKDEYEIPPNWRQDHNKRMVLNKEGRWVQEERAIPDHDNQSDMHHQINKIGLPINTNE